MKYRIVTDRYGAEPMNVTIDELQELCAEMGWEDTLAERPGIEIYDADGTVAIAIPDYCTQNDGECSTCSLANYGRDCRNRRIGDQSRHVAL